MESSLTRRCPFIRKYKLSEDVDIKIFECENDVFDKFNLTYSATVYSNNFNWRTFLRDKNGVNVQIDSKDRSIEFIGLEHVIESSRENLRPLTGKLIETD